MTKEEFEKVYCERSGITLEEYHETQVTLPCCCGYDDCLGWAVISNDPRLIEWHKRNNRFYFEEEDEQQTKIKIGRTWRSNMKLVKKMVLCDVCDNLAIKHGYSIKFLEGCFNFCNSCMAELKLLIKEDTPKSQKHQIW